MRRVLIAAALAYAAGALAAPAVAQVQPEAFSYPVGLDPQGDNWVALRTLPSGSEGARVARLGPDTLFTELGRQGSWVRVRLFDGETGWVHARHVGCCRTAVASRPYTEPVRGASCQDLWYERNAIFKAAGYCFRSARGIQMFGNAGCQFDDEADVPLSVRQREQVAQLRVTERRLGCMP